LVGIVPAPKGVPKIEVTFDIDANGIVHVSAKDLNTGKEQKIQVQASGGLTDAQINKMMEDAKLHEEEDRKHKELAENVNQAERLINEINKNLDEHKDKLQPEQVETLKKQVSDLQSLISQRNDPSKIKSTTEDLQKQFYSVFETIYKNQSQSSSEAAGSSGQNDNVQDADVRDKDKDK